MPDRIPDALRLFRERRNAQSWVGSAGIGKVRADLRRRAFFISKVTDAEILDAFRGQLEDILAGKQGEVTAEKELARYLDEIGYAPAAEDVGTIKDLRTRNRIMVVLRTNVEQARGHGMWTHHQASIKAFPAWKFYRMGERMEPRNWVARWEKAYAATSHVPGATPCTGDQNQPGSALINHPIWTALSAFGNPWPIFDFESGMQVEPMSRRETRAQGLPEEMEPLPEQGELDLDDPLAFGLNRNLQARPPIKSAGIRGVLGLLLGGLAEWVGDALVFNDGEER